MLAGTFIVMAALDEAIQEKAQCFNDFWMAGSRPAMTTSDLVDRDLWNII
jgi:hypothetical protein